MYLCEKQIVENPDKYQDVIDNETFDIMRDNFNQLWEVEKDSFRNAINDPKYDILRKEGY